MNRHAGSVVVGLASAGLTLVVVGTMRSAVAQQPGLTLPANCADGHIVVADGRGRLVCRPPREALLPSTCNAGDFLVADNFGRLRCQTPPSSSTGARMLLPTCPSGEGLVSEGSSGWRCTRGPLPSCSSGEGLVSEGSSGWRCARGSLPSCSSGQILVSEGSSGWRCSQR